MPTLERVKTTDQFELQGLLYTPQQKTDIVVLHCHGMAGNFYENRFVNITGLQLVAHGIAFCAMNNRGHDMISDFIVVKEGKIEYARVGEVYERVEDAVKDIAAWVDFLKEKGFAKIILMGHSLGAVKAVLYAKEYQNELKGLILASPPDMHRHAKVEKDFAQKMDEAKELVAQGQERKLLSKPVLDWYPISAGTYLNLFTEGGPADVFSIESGKKPTRILKLNLPILVLFGEKDDCYDYGPEEIRTFFITYLKNAKMEIVPKANHVYLNQEEAFAQLVLKFAENMK